MLTFLLYWTSDWKIGEYNVRNILVRWCHWFLPVCSKSFWVRLLKYTAVHFRGYFQVHPNGYIGVSLTAQASVRHIEAPETTFLQERCSDPRLGKTERLLSSKYPTWTRGDKRGICIRALCRTPGITESWNQRIVWVGRKFKAHQPQPCSGCPGPHPAWPWAPPGMGHPQLYGQLCQGLTALSSKNFFLTSNLNFSSFSLNPFPPVLSLSDHVTSHPPFCL